MGPRCRISRTSAYADVETKRQQICLLSPSLGSGMYLNTSYIDYNIVMSNVSI